MDVRFVSKNKHKIREVSDFFSSSKHNILPLSIDVIELQTNDMAKLVEDKVVKAFQKVGRPLFVEHTGLYLESLNEFPGGLTQVFWDTIEAERFASIFGNLEKRQVKASTTIGYCDGKNIKFFEGDIKGKIAKQPLGDCIFQWDCVFIPDGFEMTFAQLGSKKSEISMRKKAFDKFIEYLDITE